MRGAAAIARLQLPERFGGQHLPRDRADRSARAKARRADASSRRGSREAVKIALERERAGAAVPQPARLCAADAVPRLRLPPRNARTATPGWSSIASAPAGLPSLRLLDAAAGRLPEMRGERDASSPCGPGVERLEEEARALFPGRAHAGAVERSHRRRRAHARGARRRSRRAASTSSSARSSSPRAIIFPSSIWSAWSTPISASATAIRARPSAPSSCCIRSSGRAGREEGRGIGYLQTHQPEHPVMRALIARRPRGVLRRARSRRARAAGYPPFGRLASLRDLRRRQPAAEGYARAARRQRRRSTRSVRVLGPAEAPLAVVRGRHRFRLLVKSPAQFRSVGLSARMARRRAEAEGRARAGGRRRSAELLIATAFC